MLGGKGRKRKGEKKVNTEVIQEAPSENLSTAIQTPNMNEDHLTQVLKNFFQVIAFLNLLNKFYLLCRRPQMKIKKEQIKQEM